MTFQFFVSHKNTKYLTTGRKLSAEGLNEIQNLVKKQYKVSEKFDNLEDVKNFWKKEKEEKRKEKTKNYKNQHTYRSRLNLKWKAERLYVPEFEEIPGTSIVENIDPGFFSIVSGRHIKEKKNLREYLTDIRTSFLLRLKTNFHKDETLLMDECHMREVKMLNGTKTKFFDCKRGFEMFLEKDYIESRKLLKIAAKETEKSNEKLKDVKELKKKVQNYEAIILKLEEQWRNCRMFQRFLYITAPLDWRKIYDLDNLEKDNQITISDPCQFNCFRESLEEVSLNYRILKFRQDIQENKVPQLYFTNPKQLLNILLETEKNNMRALQYCRKLNQPTEIIFKELQSLKEYFEQQQKIVEEEIQYLYELVQKEEKKCEINKKNFRHIAFGAFRNLLIDKEFLDISVYVEDTYESVVAQNHNNLSLTTMVKDIEIELENCLLALDLLPHDVMLHYTSRFYEEQRKTLAEAVEAEKKVHQMETLLKRLSKALMSPEKHQKKRRLVQRSQPPQEPMQRKEIKKILAVEEKEKLYFFGDSEESDKLSCLLCLK